MSDPTVAEGWVAAPLTRLKEDARLISGVLLYRFVSFWLILPVGWLAWSSLRRDEGLRAAPGNRPAILAGWATAA